MGFTVSWTKWGIVVKKSTCYQAILDVKEKKYIYFLEHLFISYNHLFQYRCNCEMDRQHTGNCHCINFAEFFLFHPWFFVTLIKTLSTNNTAINHLGLVVHKICDNF